jgi:hypothetical protein
LNAAIFLPEASWDSGKGKLRKCEILRRQFFKTRSLTELRIRARERHWRISREWRYWARAGRKMQLSSCRGLVSLEGLEYTIYRLGLARAYLEAKRLPEALAAAKQSAGRLDLVEPQLELDRVRAILFQAEIQFCDVPRPGGGGLRQTIPGNIASSGQRKSRSIHRRANYREKP